MRNGCFGREAAIRHPWKAAPLARYCLGMSQENVEIVWRALEAWGRGDRQAVVDLLDPEVEWSMPANIPDAGIYRGRDEVVQRLEEFLDAWEDLAVTVEELVDAGDRVVAFVRYSGRGRESGIEISGVTTDAQV